MVSEKVRVNNPSGLHLRPAGILCKEAMKYKSLITFQYGQGSANAKSVLSVLGACVKCGDEITIFCEGEDETEALRNLVTVINGYVKDGSNLFTGLKRVFDDSFVVLADLGCNCYQQWFRRIRFTTLQ